MKLPPVALGALGGLGAAALLTPFAADAMRDLRAARIDRATLAALAAGPPPSRAVVADGLALSAPDAGAAADLLATRLRASAAQGGLLVEEAVALPSPALARVRVRVSGGEDAVIAFADRIERARPMARFAGWTVAARGGQVTLSGEVVAPWQ
ncbi:MAG: hypothetical protein V4537_12285 [Pseudomonadota bacterium]